KYVDIERAWTSGESWQEPWAFIAEDRTAHRTLKQIQSAVNAKDFKVADTLAAHAIGITRAHKQVLLALASGPVAGKTVDEVQFLDERINALTEVRARVDVQFASAYDRTEL